MKSFLLIIGPNKQKAVPISNFTSLEEVSSYIAAYRILHHWDAWFEVEERIHE